MGAELHVVAGQRVRLDHLDRRHDLLELLDPALDERLALPRRVVFGVLGQVAMAARLGDGADDRRAFLPLQAPQLIFKPLQAAARHRKFLQSRSPKES